ncbi:MCP four helix bundle domain-containing protein, partial [Massilia terrae]
MPIFADMTTRAKLTLGFGLLVATMVVASAMSYQALTKLRASQQTLFTDDLGIALKMVELRNAINRERVALLSSLVTQGGAQVSFNRQLDIEEATIRGLIAELEPYKDVDEEFGRGYARLLTAHDEYAAIRDGEVVAPLKAGERNVAVSAVTGNLQRKFDQLKSVADEMGKEQLSQARQRMRDSDALVQRAGAALFAIGAGAAAVAFLMGWWLNRSIAAPLRAATTLAARI